MPELINVNFNGTIYKIGESDDKSKFSLGFGPDGLLYIYYDGIRYGTGVDIENGSGGGDGTGLVTVFQADFSGEHPSASQFYTWDGRDYDNAITDSLSNIDIIDSILHLKSRYDSSKSRWIRQMVTTGGLFESDNFTCIFRAKFEDIAGAWQNVITYGTGTHWTNGTYSDGVKWPSGGEIDAFEQAGGYAEHPNTFSPVFHYGSGTNSGYPNIHLSQSIASGLSLPVDEFADFKFELKNGIVKIYVNNALVAQGDGSSLIVNNNYLWNYKPFLKPQAFYLDGSVASGSASIDTSNTYDFQISEFKILQEEDVACTALSIHPQMWDSGTPLVFPVNAEIYLDREYTPSNTSNKACTWESSDTSVATVCQGFVKTLSNGSATITARCGSATATYTIIVSSSANVPCAGVVIGSENIQTMAGETTDLSSLIYKYPGFTTENITLSSSDTSVATVSGTTVTGIGEGTATITISCGNASTAIPISVQSGVIFESDVTLAPDNVITTLSDEAITYDQTKTYSIQYTFSAITPGTTATTPNCIVGPVTSNNAERAGAVRYIGASAKWVAQRGARSVDISPVDGDKVTFVINFATGKQSIYVGNTAVESDGSIQTAYYENTAKLIAGRQNANMTVAPSHIKIALGDLH